ncbi:hypothetical protein [Selenomonas ruminantium]|uniref:Uncharacterized protein n=1 Tax=Selenomonas ruminantium TaxID=971 RepID=A0A1H0NJG3_SELRU|nr:hypothetical protein [Selenomonas ruminantium]SDO92813.1 hypothetical protein SAMN05216366_103102 [Selenomonas ruminantium]
MKKEIIGGGIGVLVGRSIGGIGIAAMGGAVGIPAAAVTVVAAVGGAAIGNQVGKLFDDEKK